MKPFRILSLAVVAIFSASCGNDHNVMVVNPSGRPLADATVTPMTRAYTKPSRQTDAQGGAMVIQDYPFIEWIQVSKPGFQTTQVSYAQPKPITVTLSPIVQ